MSSQDQWNLSIRSTKNAPAREDQGTTIAYLVGDELPDETTDEKLDKKKVAEARREEMKYFEAMGKPVRERSLQTKELDDDP